MDRSLLGSLGGILVFVGFFFYYRAILQKTMVPSKASWIIWAITDTVLAMGMYERGALNTQMACITGATWGIFALALFFGKLGWTLTDTICCVGAAIGIFFMFAGDHILAIVTSCIVISIGMIPTVLSALENPENENRLAWLIICLSSACATLAIPKMTIEDAAQPITFVILQGSMVYLLYFRRVPHLKTV